MSEEKVKYLTHAADCTQPDDCKRLNRDIHEIGYCRICNPSPNHGKRGPDKKPRPGKDTKSFQAKYWTATGRTVNQDMRRMQERIATMQELADQTNDPVEKFKMLETVQNLEDKFYKTFGPYMLQKQATMKTNETEEEKISLEDVLNGADPNGNEDPGSY